MFARLFAVAMIFGLSLVPAAAQQELFDVVGVAARNVLVVRRTPSPQGETIGALSPQAVGIVVMQRDGDWAQVKLDERALGWVPARNLRRAAVISGVPARLVCRGTEPSWALTVVDRDATFEMFQDDPQREASKVSRRRTSRNNATITAFSFGFHGRDRAVLRHSRVCDSATGDVAEFDAVVMRRDGTLLSGCCRPAN